MTVEQILTVEQMRAAEQRIFDAGTPVFDLMQLASGRASEWVRRIAAGRRVTILCGPGNNGGDGYVMAHRLSEAGLKVQVVAPDPPKTDAAQKARDLWGKSVVSSGGEVQGEVFVDCLFGSGLTRPLSAAHFLLLRDLSERHQFRIALDMPSGIASDTGALLNEKLPRFDATLALGAWKFAHFMLPGRNKMGVQRLVPIGVEAVDGAAEPLRKPNISAPASDAHKYTRGLGVIVGGAMPGAGRLAAEAAMRGGAGYIKLARQGEATGDNPALVETSGDLEPVLDDKRTRAVLVGPGLGRDEKATARLTAAISSGKPLVLDADALMLLKPDMLGENQPILATPHDGELEALCKSFAVIAEGRRERALALARAANIVVLAKGPDTVIAAPDGRLRLARPAPSWLSVAGSGDVLAGIALSRLANGADPFHAACEAVWLHGEAARHCGPAFTPLQLAHSVPTALTKCL
ncbi:NAD(P)H-hydrate dehydratase [Erythrobacter sp. SCSIO 43205]|uniref:NAD(P)H-hydrate dehydratase n=1 Tax=Erythrobacter sp. SCSIO 43205 TaxID=2779361 RepID=UPI001CA97BF9|nr:NAD(P)H-hydrate dehydratase [Erythrobacter sp. SCSIO 43205]UAB77281.1 NAD(P)H-hydrate dehydratase [Erythrobacter sp. SCSIO 43205]